VVLLGLNSPNLWKYRPTWAMASAPPHYFFLAMFLWSWERTGNSSYIEHNPPPATLAKWRLKQIPLCPKCNDYKPYRSHHCRLCGKCVLKMDHHCPWIGTCVGLRNYKPFFLFVTYACLSLLSFVIVALPSTPFLPESSRAYPSDSKSTDSLPLATGIMFCFSLLLTLVLIYFWVTHFQLIYAGKTTIERILSIQIIKNPPWDNFHDVLGRSLWLWPLPILDDHISGYDFEKPTSSAKRKNTKLVVLPDAGAPSSTPHEERRGRDRERARSEPGRRSRKKKRPPSVELAKTDSDGRTSMASSGSESKEVLRRMGSLTEYEVTTTSGMCKGSHCFACCSNDAKKTRIAVKLNNSSPSRAKSKRKPPAKFPEAGNYPRREHNRDHDRSYDSSEDEYNPEPPMPATGGLEASLPAPNRLKGLADLHVVKVSAPLPVDYEGTQLKKGGSRRWCPVRRRRSRAKKAQRVLGSTTTERPDPPPIPIFRMSPSPSIENLDWNSVTKQAVSAARNEQGDPRSPRYRAMGPKLSLTRAQSLEGGQYVARDE